MGPESLFWSVWGGPKLSQGSSPEGDQGVKVTTVDDVMTEARGWNDMRKGREAQH